MYLILLGLIMLLTSSLSSVPQNTSHPNRQSPRHSDEKPLWSPDGTRIAFVSDRSGNTDIWVMQPDGSELANLTTEDERANLYFAWDPGGNRILYTSLAQDLHSDIWIVDSDGKNAINLSEKLDLGGRFLTASPAWSPNGEFIAFVSENLADNVVEVTVVETQGWNIAQVIRTGYGIGFTVVDWSPDNRHVVTSLVDIQGDFEVVTPQIWVFSVDGTWKSEVSYGIQFLLSYRTRLIAMPHVDWSNNGDRIAFSASYSGDDSIFVVDAEGGNLTRLTKGVRFSANPVWSPDDSKIAFSSLQDGSLDVWVIDSDGTSAVNLTEGSSARDHHPSWSPDQTRIAFQSDRAGDEDIWFMDADGSNLANLTGTE